MNVIGRTRSRFSRRLLALLGVSMAVLLIIYLLRPAWLLDAYFGAQRWYAGMQIAEVEVAGANWQYAEGGQGETVLLVHGMAGSKENWMLLAAQLTDRYRVIAPDQAGFGGSEPALDADYRISSQVDRLHAFADALKLERFHLVGHSMGGHSAGVFAARFPERVQSLTLMNAAGVPFKPNAFRARIEQGENPFATESIEKFDAFMRMTFERPPFAPRRFRQVYAERNAARAALWNQILRRVSSEKSRYFLQQKLPDIKAPTLVLWCDRDQLLDVSSVDAFRSGLPAATINIFKGCGHMPMMEFPELTAAALVAHFQTAPAVAAGSGQP
jgi:abhydrolase domain-containing protein 6